jgi:hypothetical protein
MVVHACNISYSGGRSRRIKVQGWPRQKSKPYLKNKLKAKMDWGVTQVVERLPNK